MPDTLGADMGAAGETPWHFERLTLPNGLNMQVARAGGGPLIVMLHGFPECWYSWRHQLRALSADFECAAPDMRGYGGTDAPVGVQNYTMERLVDDVSGLIHALGRERAIVIGHDWGGAVAWATALMRPEIVERLCVLNCPHPARFLAHLLRNPRQMMRSWYMLFFQVPYLPDAMLRARGAAMVARAIRSTAVNKAAFTDEDLAHFREAFARPYSATAAINYYRALRRRDFLRTPPPDHWLSRKIAAPTLLIWGEQDVALGKELTYGMEGLFSGPFTLKYIADSGHWVQQEKPALVNQYLREFLADGRG
ncbi:MAG: alpha/beta fold hydrolase [Candidatus Binataceae bacterium]